MTATRWNDALRANVDACLDRGRSQTTYDTIQRRLWDAIDSRGETDAVLEEWRRRTYGS